VTGLSRFRSNFYQQRGTIAMVFRQVPATIPSFEELNLPGTIEEIATRRAGSCLCAARSEAASPRRSRP